MRKFKLEIEVESNATQDPIEIGRILRNTAEYLEADIRWGEELSSRINEGFSKALYDNTGNCVGAWELSSR